LFGIYPAEAVYIVAAFIVFVISSLLFVLTFILTRSLWISIPAALMVFSILGLLDSSNSIYEGVYILPYPAIFGLLSVICLITVLQLIKSLNSILKTVPIVIISLLSVYVTYPPFLILETVVILSYYIISLYKQGLFYIKPFGKIRLYFVDRFRPHYFRAGQESGDEIISTTTTKSTEPTTSTPLTHRNMPNLKHKPALLSYLLPCSLILAGFIVPFFALGLGDYYNKISITSDSVYFEGTNIISDFSNSTVQLWVVLNSNIYPAVLVISALASSILAILVTFKTTPLLIAYLVLFASLFLSSISFTNPKLTVALMSSLSFTIMAFSIWQVLEAKGWINSKKRILATGIYVIAAFVVQIPFITSNVLSDENGSFTQFGRYYDIGRWVDSNISSVDRVLNDGSLYGYYLNGFSVLNLTYKYPSNFVLPPMQSNFQDFSMEQRMVQELNAVIWQNPNEPELLYPLLDYYNISYIVLLPGSGERVAERYEAKSFDNEIYTKYFDSYDFLHANFSDGSSRIYRVK
jgi:hypothetical protein